MLSCQAAEADPSYIYKFDPSGDPDRGLGSLKVSDVGTTTSLLLENAAGSASWEITNDGMRIFIPGEFRVGELAEEPAPSFVITVDGDGVFRLSPVGAVSGDAFTTIAVPAGTNPVADGPDDTLTFALTGGATNSITGDASTDTVTWGIHDPLSLSAEAAAVLGLSTQQLTLDTQAANTFFAGPVSGADAAPTFRGFDEADGDGLWVKVSGDTMTGPLAIAPSPDVGAGNPAFTVNSEGTLVVGRTGIGPFVILDTSSQPEVRLNSGIGGTTNYSSDGIHLIRPGPWTMDIEYPALAANVAIGWPALSGTVALMGGAVNMSDFYMRDGGLVVESATPQPVFEVFPSGELYVNHPVTGDGAFSVDAVGGTFGPIVEVRDGALLQSNGVYALNHGGAPYIENLDDSNTTIYYNQDGGTGIFSISAGREIMIGHPDWSVEFPRAFAGTPLYLGGDPSAGIYTDAPGYIQTTGGMRYTTFDGAVSTNVNPSAGATVTPASGSIRLTNSGGITLNGTTAIANGAFDGQRLTLTYAGGFGSLTINNGANVRNPGAANITLANADSISYRWDAGFGDWICVAYSNN